MFKWSRRKLRKHTLIRFISLLHSERNKLHLETTRQQGMLESSYHYDPMGRLTKQHSLNHDSINEHITIQRDYHYDALGQLTHLSGHSVLDQSNKNQNQKNQFIRNHQYQYDKQGRLTEHKLTDYQNHTGITEVFAFDPASNRVPVKISDDTSDNTQINHGRPRELIQNNQRIRYTYDSHGRVLYKTTEPVTKDRQTLKHSQNSLLAHRQGLQLQYNANNELEKSLLSQYQGNKVIKTLTEYHYDAFGRRIAKYSDIRHFIQHNNQLKQTSKTQHRHTHFLWDGDRPLQDYSDTHVYTTIYEQNSFAPIARLAWLRDDIPEPINDEPIITHDNPHIEVKAETKSKIEIYHYHNDQLGTPNELTNDKGEIVWLADYEAWGNVSKEVWREETLKPLQVEKEHLQPIRFQGQSFDEETGLHYNRFRYYDPDMGMFTTRDPIGLRGGDNIFSYGPNPTGWIDPLGLMYTLDDAHKDLRAGANPNIQPVYTTMTGHKIYSGNDVYDTWKTVEDAYIANMIRTGKMSPCPKSAPNACVSCKVGSGGWKKYGGNPNWFHCGFDGYLENRIPNKSNPAPTNECFYDSNGVLVDESHKWNGCRGTPDYFPFFGTGTDADNTRRKPHATIDTGGTLGPSKSHSSLWLEALVESGKYHNSVFTKVGSTPPIR